MWICKILVDSTKLINSKTNCYWPINFTLDMGQTCKFLNFHNLCYFSAIFVAPIKAASTTSFTVPKPEEFLKSSTRSQISSRQLDPTSTRSPAVPAFKWATELTEVPPTTTVSSKESKHFLFSEFPTPTSPTVDLEKLFAELGIESKVFVFQKSILATTKMF